MIVTPNEMLAGFKAGGAANKKVGRDAFLYIGAVQGKRTGQCSSCFLWVKGHDRCLIHSANEKIEADASCGLYVQGIPQRSGDSMYQMTPKESGLVRRQVRCENCKYAKNGATVCGLYVTLNNEVPEMFALDEKIEPQGCCNAQMP
jgi:hypothetical protein